MNSIWLENKEKNEYDVLKNDIETECLIIGGGIFGTTLGYILSKNNMKVTLIERKDDLASGTTGYTTAKITSQHGRIYHYLINQFGEETARKYFQANENAVRKIQEIIQSNNIDCDFKKESSYLYSVNNDELIKLKEEYEALKKINPKAIWVENSSLPFNILGAIEFKDQASFNPYKYVKGLAKKITENGGDIFCNTICYDLEKKDSIYICKTNSYSIKAKYVVIASHYPFLNIPGFYFSKIYQTSSYVIGLDIKKKEFDGMYINIDSPTYSFRTAKINGNTILVLGGGGHKTGEMPKEDVGYESLEKVANYFSGKMDFATSSYDVKTLDEFKGVYYYQLPVKTEKDYIKILTNYVISNSYVYNYETSKKESVYNLNKLSSLDKYDVYLSGAVSLIDIVNENSTSSKELIVFRDSYGSSLIPLFINGYKKITVVDTRYISPKILNNYIDFKNKDVLFIYGVILLNDSISMK